MQKDFFGWDTPILNDLIHLSNHDTSGIMDSRGYLKLLDVHGLACSSACAGPRQFL